MGLRFRDPVFWLRAALIILALLLVVFLAAIFLRGRPDVPLY